MKNLLTLLTTLFMLSFVGCGTFADDDVNPNDKPSTEQPGDGDENENPDEGEKPNPDTPIQYKIYVYNVAGWEPLNIYMWRWDDEDLTEYVGAWSGAQVEETEVINGFTYYVYDLPTEANGKEIGVIFNNGSGLQTPDWFITVDKDYYVLLSGTTTPTIIEDKNNPIPDNPDDGNDNPDDGNDDGNDDVVNPDDYPETHKIYYTSTDGNIVEPQAQGVAIFGANIISNTYKNGQGLLLFDDDVTKIGDNAFDFCSSLTSATIGNGVTSIGGSAFRDCSSLTSITIPDSVTSIGDSAFSYCTSLTSVTIGNGVTSIEYDAFSGCSSLTSITIPNSVTSIGGGAFADCSNITSVVIGEGVLSIGSEAFSGCKGTLTIDSKIVEKDRTLSNEFCSILTDWDADFSEVILGDNITKIGARTFYQSQTIKKITWGKNITSIGKEAFYNCNGLKSIELPESIESIGHSAFQMCYSLKSISIPNSVTEIGEYAFSWCTSLTNFTIPSGVTSIKQYTFRDCTSLASITIPDAVTSIGIYAFQNCSSMTSVAIGNGVTSIGDSAFFGCSSLTSVTIGNSVSSIGDSAFWDCSSLTSITIPESVSSIGSRVFSGCTLDVFVINSNFLENVPECRYSAYSACFHWYDGAKIKNIIIGDNVTTIPDYAFVWHQSALGANTDNPFEDLQSVTIGSNITSIGRTAFDSYSCTSLTEIYCKPTTPPVIYYERYGDDDDWGGYTEFGSFPFNSGMVIYVPQESYDAYTHIGNEGNPWLGYEKYLEPYDFE